MLKSFISNPDFQIKQTKMKQNSFPQIRCHKKISTFNIHKEQLRLVFISNPQWDSPLPDQTKDRNRKRNETHFLR